MMAAKQSVTECSMATGEVCDAVTKLATVVQEVALVVERLKIGSEVQGELIKEHREWLSNHDHLLERMSASEMDRMALHEAINEIRITARWAVGLAITTLLALGLAFADHVFK